MLIAHFSKFRHVAGNALGLLLPLVCMSPLFAADGSAPAPAITQGLVTAAKSAIYIHPTSAGVNVPRTIFFVDSRDSGCKSQFFSFDASALHLQSLISIRFDLTAGICGVRPPSYPTFKTFTVTPTKAGKLTVRATRNDQVDFVEAEVTATPAARSLRNVNGMWYDFRTNGSGLSLHHSRTSDVVFGTWYIFNEDGSTRWYTLQNAYWRSNGDILEGMLIGMSGNCPDGSLVACPSKGSMRALPLGTYDPAISYPAGAPFLDAAIARITFTSDGAARAEVVDFAGNVLFASELLKLSL